MNPIYAQILRQTRTIARELGRDVPVRVLIVDEDSGFSTQLARQLRRSDRAMFEVVNAEPEQASQLLREQQWDVCVLDTQLGKIGGLEIVNCLHDEGIHFPFIIATTDSEQHREAMSHDCMGFFSKPMTTDQTAVAILDAIKNYSTRCVTSCASNGTQPCTTP